MSKMTIIDMTDKADLAARLDDLSGEVRVMVKYHCDNHECRKLHVVAATVCAAYAPGSPEMCVIVRDLVGVRMTGEFTFEPIHSDPLGSPALLYLYPSGRVETSFPLSQTEFIARGGFKWYMEQMGIKAMESGPMQA